MSGVPTAAWSGRAWSCTVRLVVAEPRTLCAASEDLRALLVRVDRAASRFRVDSEVSRANRQAGRPTPVSKTLIDLVDAALAAAHESDGAVDPTLGRTVARLGYDRDIADIADIDDGAAVLELRPSPGAWRRVRLHRGAGLLTVPAGAGLDLGATAKARTADVAARTLAARYDTAVLVELGGDLAVSGVRPDGWCVRVAEREGADGPVVALRAGGLATSTTVIRTWRRGGLQMHHIVDPRTGRPADSPWRTASVAADSALAANTASTAAIVLGDSALDWLTTHDYAARLVAQDGTVVTTAGWPATGRAAA
jgi:thiamine biosynthesis lipoprotein